MILARTGHHGGGGEMTTGGVIGLAIYIAMFATMWVATAIIITRRDPNTERFIAFTFGFLAGMVWPLLPIAGAAWWAFTKLTAAPKQKQT